MNRIWWKEAVVYQIYPRSFMDSNGDGIGDLPGIIEKLDYLKELGIDIVWLSPIFKSPNADNGYDVSDFYDIMDEFGTLQDFDRLLKEVHQRGMKLILDFVVNHSSDEHPWFIESRSSKDNPKRDFYYWREGKDGKEPNNWGSFFTESAWTKDAQTGQYYLHLYTEKQPDLNWYNPELRKAMQAAMQFWLDKGVDGFRLDALNMIGKREGLPDAPKEKTARNGYVYDWLFYSNNPGVHEFIHEMNREIWSKYDVMIVGENAFISPQEGLKYTAQSRQELDMTFQFEIMNSARHLPTLKECLKNWYEVFKGESWNTITLNNHDTPRQVSQIGNAAKHRRESAKLLATFILTAPGTPYLYQGEELGMTNVCFDSIDDYRDVAMINKYNERVAAGEAGSAVLADMRPGARDNARTSMQWNGSPNAGFTSGQPWIGVNPNYAQINAQCERCDPESVFHYYKNLIAFRKNHPEIIYGDFAAVDDGRADVYVYRRLGEKKDYLIILNFSDNALEYSLPAEILKTPMTRVISNYHTDTTALIPTIRLLAWEAGIYESE